MKLSALELSTLQAAGTVFLGAGTAIIQSATLTGDGQGGFATTWAASGTVDCRIAPVGSGAESVIAGKLTSVAPWVVTLPHDTTITTANRLVIGSRTLEVNAVMAPQSWEVHRRVICSEVA